jgi:gliding motility-associated-like protein
MRQFQITKATCFKTKIKKLLFFFSLLLCASSLKADHITGGEMYYTLVKEVNGNITYKVTLKLFMRCNSGRIFYNPTVVSVFNKANYSRISDIAVSLSGQEAIRLADAGPCITNPPVVCYEIGTYEFNITLPSSPDGYILSSQVNYRIAGISNLSGYNNIGAVYTCEIPGTKLLVNAPVNNSAKFISNDLVVVCANNSFSYSFEASDIDGDQLRYNFCDAYVSGTFIRINEAEPPLSPPYSAVPYGLGFSSLSPLGNAVKIDQNNGLITGIAPAAGVYVVTVCVEEIRNGVVIATQRKDLQINITDCDVAAAVLEPEYLLCRDTKTLSVSNLSVSLLIKTQDWQFTNNNDVIVFDTSAADVTYTFKDTGLYNIKLVINRGQVCEDSAVSQARVYPGFMPSFSHSGICFNKPTVFTNTSSTVYGTINSSVWDFGEQTTTLDTSSKYNPSYTYESQGSKIATLLLGNSNGCHDTATKSILIIDKPPLNLAFNDTLICVSDKVQLMANAAGTYNWTPAVNIVNANTSSPTVSPAATTLYYADLNDDGCLNRDSVLVRVTDHVNLTAMNDTVICKGDLIVLKVVSDGFQYSWSPASQLNNSGIPDPIATTNEITTYQVTARIGSCSATEEIVVTPVPYPLVNAGADTMICFNTSAQLHGATDGISYMWSPSAYMSDPSILNPNTYPVQTTEYILSAYDNRGCPKPGKDTVQVIVLSEVKAFAGNDTAVVIGQELQLNATGGTKYTWSPAVNLSAADIHNPVALYNTASEDWHYSVFVYNEAGCVDTASINIKVFATPPSVFVPNAFTPNTDGRNDVLKPIAAGIKTLQYFSIYNRWGRLMFSTTQPGKGWNGTFNGILQDPGIFVWTVKAIDYKGAPYIRKGTVMLVR